MVIGSGDHGEILNRRFFRDKILICRRSRTILFSDLKGFLDAAIDGEQDLLTGEFFQNQIIDLLNNLYQRSDAKLCFPSTSMPVIKECINVRKE